MAVLRIVDLHKRFGQLEVLKGVSLEVEVGETVTIIGPSGSGKTTLLRCINFLERPTSGHVYIDDELIGERESAGGYRPVGDRQLARKRTEMGMVFQRFNLWPHLTAAENVSLGLRHVLKWPKSRAAEESLLQLRKVGLEAKADTYPDHLSGGQQQRVAIARALAMRPKLLLFDEPTSSLDPELVGEVLSVMRQLSAEGRTMIVVTHEMQFAAEASDRVVFMDDGVVMDSGTPHDILISPRHERIRSFVRQVSHA